VKDERKKSEAERRENNKNRKDVGWIADGKNGRDHVSLHLAIKRQGGRQKKGVVDSGKHPWRNTKQKLPITENARREGCSRMDLGKDLYLKKRKGGRGLKRRK